MKRDELVLATARYHDADLIIESGLAAVATSVGLPKFDLGYRIAHHAKLVAPYGLLDILDEDLFTRRYRERLARHGAEQIIRVLASIAVRERTAGVALLCFENVFKGEFCHRRVLAESIEQQTGRQVPELGAAPIYPNCHD